MPSPAAGPPFDRMVDRALDSPEIAAAIAAGAGASRAELRGRALAARADLVGVAPAEYGHYLALRTTAFDRHGHTGDHEGARSDPAQDGGCTQSGAPGHGACTQGDAGGGGGRTRGGVPGGDGRTKEGILPVLAVLVPSLGAVATGVFLLCGFGLRAFAVRPHIGDGLVMAGVIAAAVTAGAALGDLAWILVTGARGRSRRGGDDPAERDPEVRRAREVWENAVVERGIVPFLLEGVESARTDPACASQGRAVGTEGRAR
ncbi:hypothetical protein [Streptomyces sp. NPDC047079]|uniref:hypothetical protein n=1 Tax=Streptomyces sp. NPDC047079 TaxID=3154607 RepID=UPI0033DB9BAC